jgi:hypothetical protein
MYLLSNIVALSLSHCCSENATMYSMFLSHYLIKGMNIAKHNY